MRRQVRGREIGYDDQGSGPAVVLLHPFPFARDVWQSVAETLGARFRVVAVDARGFGESALRAIGGASDPYSLADLADDLAALLDALEIPRAAVLGQSMGGYTALAFAARYGARLSALVLCDTRAAADTPDVRAKRDEALSQLHGSGPAAYLDGSLASLVSPGAPPAMHASVRARAETRAESLVAGIEALRDRPDRTEELAAITCPTLCVCGAEDLVTPPAEMRRMAVAIGQRGRAARGALYVELQDAGHLSHLEAPLPFATAVSSFLSDVLPGSAR
jgi:3-oxoadipate enol-lactonase